MTIVIKKEEIIEGGHHGGAWKVAYADFVTAMMAFFLLMWLLNATTETQRKGLADYFSPSNILTRSNSGNGAPFGGHTPFDEGALASDRGAVKVIQGKAPVPLDPDDEPDTETEAKSRTYREDATTPIEDAPDIGGKTPTGGPKGTGEDGGEAKTAAETQAEAAQAVAVEKKALEQAAQQIERAVMADPALAELSKQLLVDITPEGLRIQIIDREQVPMFANGSAVLNDRARALLAKIVPVLSKLPEPLSIAGHTDGAAYRGPERTNWELSAERANATRRAVVDSGVAEERIRAVAGNADRDPLLPADPMNPANRRVTITVLRQAKAPKAASPAASAAASPAASPAASSAAVPARAVPGAAATPANFPAIAPATAPALAAVPSRG